MLITRLDQDELSGPLLTLYSKERLRCFLDYLGHLVKNPQFARLRARFDLTHLWKSILEPLCRGRTRSKDQVQQLGFVGTSHYQLHAMF